MAKRRSAAPDGVPVAVFARLILGCHHCQRPTPVAGIRAQEPCAHCLIPLELSPAWWAGALGDRLRAAMEQEVGEVTLHTDFSRYTMICRFGRDLVRCPSCHEPLALHDGAAPCACGNGPEVRAAGELEHDVLERAAWVIGELPPARVAEPIGFHCAGCGGGVIARGRSADCPKCGQRVSVPDRAFRAMVPVRPAPRLYLVAGAG
jgi:hypothetical protein